jgi:hypothetical protein
MTENSYYTYPPGSASRVFLCHSVIKAKVKQNKIKALIMIINHSIVKILARKPGKQFSFLIEIGSTVHLL